MFERSFNWTMRNGPRLLFVGAVVMALAGLVSLAWQAKDGLDWESNLYNLLYGYWSPAAYLLFGAVLTDGIRRDPTG